VRILGALIDDEPIDLQHARLKHQLWLEKSRIEISIVAQNLRVDGTLSFESNYISGRLDLNSARIAEALSLAFGTSFKDTVDLAGTNIGGRLVMRGASFAGAVSLNGTTVTGPAFLDDGASFKGEVDLTGASFGSDLVLSNADFASTVRLTNAHIGSELRLGSKVQPAARWGSGPLELRNTRCASLQDRWPTKKEPEEASAWPAAIDLEGFTYDLLGGLLGGGGGPADMRARPAPSYEAWLARHRPFSPQPYKQLAKILRASGDPGKANDILYAARERQRDDCRQAGEWGKWLGMSLLKATIGYGLGRRYFWALRWVALFTLLGTLLLHFFGNQPEQGWLALAFASFDQRLPAITLDRAHEKLFSAASTGGFVQPGWLVGYFYVHKLIGWLLGIFLLAGLAGLTQRS